ncbi:MAG: SPOR domain-containing protein [Nitrospirota bacterium]|nr:SPOR domain-containing protein [Nitrospirota bacterium]
MSHTSPAMKLFLSLLAALAVLLAFAPATEAASRAEISGEYVIQLRMDKSPVDGAALPDLSALRKYRLYENSFRKGGNTWYRLRVGFFKDAASADRVRRSLLKQFPDAWVTRADASERKASGTHIVSVGRAAAASRAAAAVPPAAVPAATPAASDGPRYAVQLRRDPKPFSVRSLSNRPELANYVLYTTTVTRDGATFFQLRLGFFNSSGEAVRVQRALSRRFPGAWVTRVSGEEYASALSAAGRDQPQRAAAPVPVDAPATMVAGAAAAGVVTPPPTSAAADDAMLQKLMADARQAMVDGNPDRAIRLLIKVLSFPGHPYRADALEMLGLARERKGQLAQAKAVYDQYLKEFPEGEAAERVSQRLAGVITSAGPGPRQELRREKQPDGKVTHEVYGGFSQYYRRDVFTDPTGVQNVNLSLLTSDLDLTTRRRGDWMDVRSRLTAGYRRDFVNPKASEGRLTELNVDALIRPTGSSVRLGRQTLSTSGVLGRFDGALFRQQLGSHLKLNLVGGFPVEISNSSAINTDKLFRGASLDIGSIADVLDLNLFYVEQEIRGIAMLPGTPDSVIDRKAVGGEIRVFTPNQSYFTLVDYDLMFEKYNSVMFVGNWRLPDESSINLVLDYRNSPVLTLSNGLQGQSVTSIKELLQLISEADIRKLAVDRTPVSRTVTLGGTHPFSPKVQVGLDVTGSLLGATPDSPPSVAAPTGVPGTPESGWDIFYNMQFIASSLFYNGDITILGLRFSNTDFTDTTSFTMNSRFPIGQVVRLNPRLRLDRRDDVRNNATENIIRPEMRVDLRLSSATRLELEGGREWNTRKLPLATEHTQTWFVNLGYRIDF